MSKCALAIYMKTRFQRHAGIAQPSDLSMLAAARARAFSPALAEVTAQCPGIILPSATW